MKDGSVIAGISGVWNAVAIGEAWGKDMGASKLPSYTCDGRQVQMASFSGCKLIGVNAYSKHPVWAARLAEWITNEDNQTLRFEMRGQGPSDLKVADSEEIRQSPAIAALLEQSDSGIRSQSLQEIWPREILPGKACKSSSTRCQRMSAEDKLYVERNCGIR